MLDQDFFTSDAPPVQIPVQNSRQIQHIAQDNDQFDFEGPQVVTSNMATKHSLNSQHSQGQNQNMSSNYIDNFELLDNENLRKIKEEDERVLEKLRQKSNAEYEEKKRRKEEGQKELERFLEKKQQANKQRMKLNREQQKKKIEEYKKLSEHAGWKKVTESISLKQIQRTGKKDINRMREAITNKRSDQQQLQ